MSWKIVFAPQAHARLEEIVRFLARDDPEATMNYFMAILFGGPAPT